MIYREVQENEYFAICFSGHLFLVPPQYIVATELDNIRDYLEENEILGNTFFCYLDKKDEDIAVLPPGVSSPPSIPMIFISDSLETIVEKVKPHIVRFNKGKERKTSTYAVPSVTESVFPLTVKK